MSILKLRQASDVCLKALRNIPQLSRDSAHLERWPSYIKNRSQWEDSTKDWYDAVSNALSCLSSLLEHFPSSRKSKQWRRQARAAKIAADTILDLLSRPNWYPCKDAGENSTPDLLELRQCLLLLESMLSRLRYGFRDEAERLGRQKRAKRLLEAEIRSNAPPPPKPPTKKTTWKLDEWKQAYLAGVFSANSEKPEKPSKGEDSIQYHKLKPSDGLALGADEDWGFCVHTCVIDGYINDLAKSILAAPPYCYEPEYVGGTSHSSLGLAHSYYQGFWYFREAVVVATGKDCGPDFIVDACSRDPDFRSILQHVYIHSEPCVRGGHCYWLLLPKLDAFNQELSQITVKKWELV